MRKKQTEMNLHKGTWGGRRPGSGRKQIHSKGVAHRIREEVTRKTPMHINFRFNTSVRNKEKLRHLKRAIMNARSHGLRIIHFSLQSNHVHFIIEATSNEILTRGMRSLTITFAKALKKGKVQVERYHLHVLRTLRETRNAVLYVLFNQQKHEKGTYSVITEYSSILSLENALNLIANFATKNAFTLKVERCEEWKGDRPVSYLLNHCLMNLHSGSWGSR